MSKIKDIRLYRQGLDKINWAKANMKLLQYLSLKYSSAKIFHGLNIVMCIHLEAKTANLALALKECGANVIATGSNPLSTQDDVVAALVFKDIDVFSEHGCSDEYYNYYLDRALEFKPDLIIDDGGDLVHKLLNDKSDCASNLIGGSEETTTGVKRLKALDKANKLTFPMISVNDSNCKYLFDNRYGTGQSVFDGIMRTTNMSIAGKTVVVAGYGWCGKGVAMRAKGLGARVIVTEVNPIKGIEAVFDGFETMSMDSAASRGDIFITVTGCKDVIRKEHIFLMKDGVLLANAGHFDVEINKKDLEYLSVEPPFESRKNISTYVIGSGHRINLLGEGRLVNLACGDGHPIEIMDLSFAMQFLAMKYLVDNKGHLENKLIYLPEELDQEIALLKLQSMGFDIDKLSDEQKAYLEKE